LADSPELAPAAVVDGAVSRVRPFIAGYAVAIDIALALEGLVNAGVGATLCALLIAVLVNHHIAALGGEPDAGAFLVLALVPLAGLLSVVMPVAQFTHAAWPFLAAAPTLMAVALSARQLGLRREDLGLTLNRLRPQVRIALIGVPLGMLAFGGMSPITFPSGPVALAVAALAGLAFTEELLFRGLVQPLMLHLYGEAGIAITASFSAVVALGTRSLPDGLCAGLLALGFAIAARRTGSIAGVSVARAFIYIGLFAWPHLL
jgi:membrane protease YdiL (CAAX protease family)